MASNSTADQPFRIPSKKSGDSKKKEEPKKPPPSIFDLHSEVLEGTVNPFRDKMPTELCKRDGKFGKAGKKALIEINSHIVKAWPNKSVYQYDIQIGSGAEKRGLIKAVWDSQAVQTKLGQGFIFDGNKIGWSPKDFGQGLRIKVDLDAERGRQSKPGRENHHSVRIEKAKNDKIYLSVLRDYLDGKCDFNNGILEAINFLDHLLRETPSKNLINLRRSYFARQGPSEDRTLIGGAVEAMHGIYQSIRMAEGRRLVVNADVSNSCFWHETLFTQLGMEISGFQRPDPWMATLLPKNGLPGPGLSIMRRLIKCRFVIKHRGQLPGQAQKEWTVVRFSHKTAKTHEFQVKDRETGESTTMNVFQYYLKKYNVRIDKWMLPLIETQKRDVLFPLELAIMAPRQKYPYKLNETQTANMIKFAVSRPPVRREGIRKGLELLNWQGDPMLRGYNLQIDPNMLKTNARILEPPEVQFGKNVTAKPMYSGRWDLRGKVFLHKNPIPLKAWGIAVINDPAGRPPCSTDQVNAFKNSFIKLYLAHGGEIEERNPPVVGGVPDAADCLEAAFKAAGNKANLRPQMLLVVLPNKAVETYTRVKRNCDCRFGIMSQCVQSANVIKNQPQYQSNVLMKFNCKLGGTTSGLKSKHNHFPIPTMIIGADVSHAAPGLEQASMAAMTVSLDKTCSRYGASVESNGKRVEMITPRNVENMITELVDLWQKGIGQGRLPQHVYYFRDGVSEGQYIPLLKAEVADIKSVFHQLGNQDPRNMPKFTVVVAEKRHHIRFFPPNGPAADKNGNPVPGVIVDRDVTLPFENDVYLCSHAAIQGTARPTHYTIVMDEMNVDPDKFQAMLYEHSYQYQRATTPVSLFPAVYYAHLASKRGEAHINMDQTRKELVDRERAKHPGIESSSHSKEMAKKSEWPALMKFQKQNRMHLGMWYI